MPSMRICLLVRAKFMCCLIHHKIMISILIIDGYSYLLVKSTYISRVLILCVLLNQHLPLPLHLLSFFNRGILLFVIGRYSSKIVLVCWWLTISSDLFMNLVNNLLRSEILFMGSSVRNILI